MFEGQGNKSFAIKRYLIGQILLPEIEFKYLGLLKYCIFSQDDLKNILRKEILIFLK
jgi:hypothetical protein